MPKIKNYEDLLNSNIINARPSTLSRKLKISPVTASWLKKMIKENHQEIVKNEIANLSTDTISDKLHLPFELATWVKEALEKEIRHNV